MFEDIVESYFNGQGRQMVSQIEEFGWYDFAGELLNYEFLDDAQKIDLMVTAIRISKR